MKTNLSRTLPLTLIAVIAFAGSALNARAAEDELAGTWLVTETFSDGSVSKGLITFEAVPGEDDGTLTSSFDNSLSSPHPCLPEQGTWKRTDGRTFIASDRGFCYSLAHSTLTSFEPVIANYRFTLSGDGETFSGTGDIVIPTYFKDTYTITGVRQHAHPPAP